MSRSRELFDRPGEVPVLLFERAPDTAFTVRMRGHRLTVGRGPASDVQLPDPGLRLSRSHLVLERRPTGVVLKDRSTHGTFVDGRAVGGDPVELCAGTRVQLGDWSLVLARQAWSTGGEESTRPVAASAPRVERVQLQGIVGRSPAMLEVCERVIRLARFDVPVLVTGETGTGKELVAQALHTLSGRSRGPVVALNCGAIHPGTAASELFGHVRGAFTGADGRKAGVFERAAGGTVFLDELGELPLAQQAALLRVLETHEVVPMGASNPIPVDFRLVGATHRDLPIEVAARRFRQDLYYRVAVAGVPVPPLRERGGDLRLLAEHFVAEAAVGSAAAFTEEALRALEAHDWPGNVRELRNVIQRALIASDGRRIEAPSLELDRRRFLSAMATTAADRPVPDRRPDSRRARLIDALHRCGGNKTRAAVLLGISRSTLYEQLKRAGLVVPKRAG